VQNQKETGKFLRVTIQPRMNTDEDSPAEPEIGNPKLKIRPVQRRDIAARTNSKTWKCADQKKELGNFFAQTAKLILPGAISVLSVSRTAADLSTCKRYSGAARI
jgi:hypothetical protein